MLSFSPPRSRPLVRIQLGVRHARALLLPTLACVLIAGCGSAHHRRSGASSATGGVADARAALPAGWQRVVNTRAGFNVGIPPGWQARGGQGTTIVRSSDGALAAAITADRSGDGLSLGLAQYLRRTAATLSGYRGLRLGAVTPIVATRYPTAAISARGTFTSTRVRQAILLIGIKRRGDATYTLLFFRSASVPATRYAALIEAMVRSLRAQPPEY
jgi:hypothetical protein